MFFYLVISSLFLFVAYWYVSKPNNLPPGPSGLPIIGYLPWLIKNSGRRAQHFIELGKIYGDVFCIRIFFSYIVVLNNYDVIKEAFVHKADAFSGRALPVHRQYLTKGKGLLSAEGSVYRTQRRFLMRILRGFGFGQVSFESGILTEISELFHYIDEVNSVSQSPQDGINLYNALTEHVANNIATIIFGNRLERDEIKLLVKQLTLASQIPAAFILANAIPSLMRFSEWPLLRKYISVNKILNLRVPLQRFTVNQIEEHHQVFDDSVLSDVVHAYIAEQKKLEGTDEAFWWDDEQIKHIAVELLITGTESTKSTIIWSLIYLSQHQDVQKQMQAEIDRLVGYECSVSLQDKNQLPFVEAVMLEVLRYSSISPTAVPHSTTQQTELNGYTIPKDFTILANTYQVARDPTIWSKPYKFDPTANFLSADQTTVINKDKLIPFSIGRRSCIGEPFARMQIFLFLANIFQRYTVSFPQSEMQPTLNPGSELFRNPQHFTFCFKKRID